MVRQLGRGATPIHIVVGLGALHERAGDRASWYVVPEIHSGLGVTVPIASREVVLEIGAQAVFSCALANCDYIPVSTRLPLTVRVDL